MHPRTIATIDRLKNATWFSRLGVKDTEAAIVVSSWHKAIEYCSSPEWEGLCLEACNQYRQRLLEASIERYRQWNKICVELKEFTIPFVRMKIESVTKAHELPDVIENQVQWDILHVCMEAEYADVCPPGFYASQAYWYIKGHFPCGWEGRFPKGKLIIY